LLKKRQEAVDAAKEDLEQKKAKFFNKFGDAANAQDDSSSWSNYFLL